MSDKPVTMTVRIEVAPWVSTFIGLMLRRSCSERMKATISTFVMDHGIVCRP